MVSCVEVHLVGVAGVGMSALAQAFLGAGYRVSGSDRYADRREGLAILDRLEALGVALFPQDEKPHVEYLRTALSEARARSIRTVDGKEISGKIVVDEFLHRILHAMTRERQRDQRDDLRANLIEAMQVAASPKALLEEFDSLDVAWAPPTQTGFVSTRSSVAA